MCSTLNVPYATVNARKRMLTLIIMVLSIFTILFFRTLRVLHRDRRELDETKFLYLACNEKFMALKRKTSTLLKKEREFRNASSWPTRHLKSSRLRNILKSINGTKAITGLYNLKTLESSNFILPHFKNNKESLVPAYHLCGGRNMVDIIIGITTVKRYKISYLMNTLKELMEGLSEEEKTTTLIIVMIGEIDLEYVLTTASNIEKSFTEEVKSGLIEIISPCKSYYPTKEIPATLGDSLKRTLWRAKHILDCVYIMAYGHTKGSYYMIMEDDIVAKKGYMTEMKQVIGFTSRFKKQWLIINFSHQFNGLGKLLRCSDVEHFIKYLQLFYYNMPLDYLIESYLHDKVCDISKYSRTCITEVNKLKVRSPVPLFKHVGLYSSLKGKIQKVEVYRYFTGPTFYPHANPPLKYIHCAIREAAGHTIEMAYEGKSYFLGLRPKNGSVIEFYFREPTVLNRYRFQSGNYLHKNYIFRDTVVEVHQFLNKYTIVGVFDEFGHSEASLVKFGALIAIRLRMINVTKRNVILSEIELVPDNSTKQHVSIM